jgi:hypothetical protein
MGWMLLFMVVILKIPLAGACWLIWYAIKDQPDTEEEPAPGGEDRGPRRKVPQPPFPRWPRRGPAGGGAGSCKPPPCPQERDLPLERPAPVYARRS